MSVKKYLTLNGLTYFLNKIKTYLTSNTYLNSIGIFPNNDNSVDLGDSSKNIKMIYTEGITINGTQFLPSDYATLSGLSAVATSGSYNDLDNLPTIPTVNDATLTIQKNGVDVQTFTANASSNVTANITVPTKTSDITNDSNFVDTSNSAVSSGITSAKVTDYDTHIADTDIHVTSSDKTSWNTVTSKANDSDVVHKSGNETKSGELTLSDTLKSSDIVPLTNFTFSLGSPDYKYSNVYAYMYNSIGRYFGNEASSNQRTNITLYSNRDAQNKSCAYITRFRSNRSQGALQTGDLQKIGFDVVENEIRTNNVFDIQCTNWLNNVPQRVNFVSSAQSYSYGHSTKKALINELNPGALSMPDLSSRIDISSYVTNLSGTYNAYTPSVDGWIAIQSSNATFIRIADTGSGGLGNTVTSQTAGILTCMIPVRANRQNNIYIVCTTLTSAYFIPCQGNV